MSANKRITVGIWVSAEPLRLSRTLNSIRAYTSEAINVVLLPDGPTALPLEILSQLGHIPQLGTCQPLGAPACFNRLIAYDDAEIAIFLESGSIVTAGWLERLLEALRSDAGYGLAGPSTNLAWNEQHLQDAPSAEAEDQE